MSSYDKLRPWTQIESCECREVTSLFLVDMLTDNPIHCGHCRREIDPEVLRLSSEETEAIASWFSVASSLYRLWLDSGEYEEFAKQALCNLEGQINKKGRDLAKMLSKRIPTKVWVFHDTDDGEPETCPACGEKLDLEVKWGTGCCHACKIQI